jgi:hypothetical protein
VCMSLCISLSLSIYLSIYLSPTLSLSPTLCLSLCIFMRVLVHIPYLDVAISVEDYSTPGGIAVFVLEIGHRPAHEVDVGTAASNRAKVALGANLRRVH